MSNDEEYFFASSMFSNIDELVNFDEKHVWHPYTSITHPLPVYLVKNASGCTIELMDGRILVDGMSSWWSAIHGYGNETVNRAMHEQIDRMSHVMFGGFTHQPATELAKLLIDISPDGLDHIFLCDSGSVAVEVAMKMAMQYFYARKEHTRKKFITIRSGYHGDTFHAMAVCDPENGMHSIYTGSLPEYHFCTRPHSAFSQEFNEKDLNSVFQTMELFHNECCAVILEPVVQGAGGMHFYHPEFLRRVKEECEKYGLLLICDEIATGLGRTGEMFGCNHAGISPDIMCLGKTLTGGNLTLGAVLSQKQIGEAISANDPGVFMHGPTYMANPLACTAAFSSISLLLKSPWKKRIKSMEEQMKSQLKKCQKYPWVEDVRVLGGIGVVELTRKVDQAKIQKKFVDKGVWIRPFNNLVYLMPPYIISEDELSLLTTAVCEVLDQEEGW